MSGAKVVNEKDLVAGSDGIHRPSLSSGSASTLSMNDDEKKAAAEREQDSEKPRIGFA